MGLVLETLLEVLRRPRPTMVSVLAELLLFLGPLWVAVLVGLVVGWAWKPKWVNLGRGKSGVSFSSSSLPALLSDGFGFGCIPSFSSLKAQLPAFVTGVSHESGALSSCPSLGSMEKDKLAVTGEDLNYICQLVEVKDGGPSWIPMMDRSTASMSYQAWRRDPETGPPQYRSRTVYEDATPELVRDFFWDDEFRAKWDDMLLFSSTLEECHGTGTMVVQWVRKFPFFCSDREYIIGRRIWQSGQSYYCVTKGVPCSSIPRRNKPRRVDLYYSSWCIRAVESRKGDGQLTACEVLLFHYEDMGIPWEIAKLGVRQGMWGAVKKIEPGLRAYQMARKSGVPLSPSASLAQINSQVNPNYLRSVETANGESSEETLKLAEKQLRKNIPRLLIVGGAVVLACSLDRGLLTKAVIFGVARRFGMFGRRL